ncbi:hypothetical protein B9G53_22685 [Pseudanabaena sp. SR411]|nr:hypothetical protein B9G53_22685 [Pseudanabaena sp. SR411]
MYKKKGIIESVVFEDVFDKTEFPVDRFKYCVRVAENASECEFYVSAEIIVPYGFQFQSCQSLEVFSLLTHDAQKTNIFPFLSRNLCKTDLQIKIQAFDDADANHQFMLYARPIVDVLSAFTNLFFDIGKPRKCVTLLNYPQPRKSMLNHDWLDGYPIVENKLMLPDHCLKLIEDIVQSNINKNKQFILDACHHFHSARSSQERDSVYSQTESISEIAMVLYISSVEVLSLINSSPPSNCPTCSQPQRRISSRVVEFMERHNGTIIASLIKELYNNRSKYLHSGRLLSSRSYNGTVIPQLKSSSDNGVLSPMSLAPIHNLREFTSFCIRAETYNEYNLTSNEYSPYSYNENIETDIEPQFRNKYFKFISKIYGYLQNKIKNL